MVIVAGIDGSSNNTGLYGTALLTVPLFSDFFLLSPCFHLQMLQCFCTVVLFQFLILCAHLRCTDSHGVNRALQFSHSLCLSFFIFHFGRRKWHYTRYDCHYFMLTEGATSLGLFFCSLSPSLLPFLLCSPAPTLSLSLSILLCHFPAAPPNVLFATFI